MSCSCMITWYILKLLFSNLIYVGRTLIEDKLTSCQSLKKSGSMESMIYTLKSPENKFPRLSFCDMENSEGYDDLSMETLIGFLNYSPIPESIVFSAISRVHVTQTTGEFITFEKFLVNVGNTFDLETGTFTPTVDGIYEFTFYGDANNANDLEVNVMHNGVEVLSFFNWDSQGSEYEEIGTTWMLSMKKSDSLQLQIVRGKLYSDENCNKVFTGKFIRII